MLAIENNPNAVDMVHYLYDKTLKEDLMPRKGVIGATVITQCIYAKAFGNNFNYIWQYICCYLFSFKSSL